MRIPLFLSSSLVGLACSVLLPFHTLAGSQGGSWPCIQRKVDSLSFGQMWPHPLEAIDGQDSTRQDRVPEAEANALVLQLSLRRTSLEEAGALLSAFLQRHPGLPPAFWGRIYARILDHINQRRKKLIAGIIRYTHDQQARAKRVNALRQQMADAETSATPDFDRIDRLERELDWEERIHRDRERSLTYVCETPVLLEKRAFSIARLLLTTRDSDLPKSP